MFLTKLEKQQEPYFKTIFVGCSELAYLVLPIHLDMASPIGITIGRNLPPRLIL
jgi:hypothetical protein